MIKYSVTCAITLILGHSCDDEFDQRVIYSSHLNSRKGLLARLTCREYSWVSTGTRLTLNNLAQCASPLNQKMDGCDSMLEKFTRLFMFANSKISLMIIIN